MIASDSHFSGRGSQKVAKVLPITDLRTLCYGTEKKRATRRSPRKKSMSRAPGRGYGSVR